LLAEALGLALDDDFGFDDALVELDPVGVGLGDPVGIGEGSELGIGVGVGAAAGRPGPAFTPFWKQIVELSVVHSSTCLNLSWAALSSGRT